VDYVSDLEIIKEFQLGKTDRFEFLVKRYASLCHYYFQQRRSIDQETAQDLTQEVLLRIYKNLKQFEPRSSLKAWILTICRNVANDFFRRKKEPEISQYATQEDIPQSAEFETAQIQRKSIADALDVLPERQKEIIEMKYFWQMSCDEIANIMGIPSGTVKSDLFRARLRLFEIFDGGEEK